VSDTQGHNPLRHDEPAIANPTFTRQPVPSGVGPLALIILDGFGLRQDDYGNAVNQAHKPVFDALWESYPHTTLQASEEAVGLPKGQFGNSEVGHSNIGAGRVLYQSLTRINKDIRDGDFFHNSVLLDAMQHAKQHGTALHLFGLVSDGGVHSHINHLIALLKLAQSEGLTDVFVHAVTDGRDVAPTTGAAHVQHILDTMAELGIGRIATVQGRYYAMDRDKRWDRVEKSYRAMVAGAGNTAEDAVFALRASYATGTTDEFVLPTVIVDEQGTPVARVQAGDAVIVFNFRPDRSIQISQAFTQEDFSGFERSTVIPDLYYVCMTKYSDSVKGIIAYPPTNLLNTLGEVLANTGLTQLRVAETEKFPHVTFFFSGGQEAEFPGERRILVPSPKVATYDLQPEMSAFEVAEKAATAIQSGELDVIVLNFANPDMVGHTGDLRATTLAVEVVDKCLGTVLGAIRAQGGVALITADHGNADVMMDGTSGEPCTTHTLSLVPLIATLEEVQLRADGVLADLAPTMLDLLGVRQPPEMTGRTLIVRG